MKKDIQFHFNMIKGRVAEAVVQEMLLYSGYEVFHFGMEHTVPGITGKLNLHNDPVSLLIRNTPDFVVKEPDTGRVHLLEVKYRANGKYARKDLPDYYAYPETWFVIVSPKAMKCISFAALEAGQTLSPACTNHLTAPGNPFDITEEVQAQFQAMAGSFYKGV